MPGSYPDPQSYANTALEALEQAYEESQDSPAASMVLKAMEAIRRLKQEIRNNHISDYDPHELNEFNSAI